MTAIIGKYWDSKKYLVLNTSDDHPEIKNDEIPQENIKCEECKIQLQNDMRKISY